MDTEYFRSALRDKKLSQRGLARLMEIDQAAVSLMFRGKRNMSPQEAQKISTILGLPVLEVLRRAGVDVKEDISEAFVAAHMDYSGVITAMPAGTHDVVTAPGDCPRGTFAIQVRAHNSHQDGWLLFITPSQSEAVENYDKLCACATRTGKTLMGVVRRGYRRDTHNLILWPSNETIQDADLAWVAPVLWIKPS